MFVLFAELIAVCCEYSRPVRSRAVTWPGIGAAGRTMTSTPQ